MTNLTDEQLPTSNAQFIAYGSPTRVADPFGGDDAISVRPQVFVRYYRGIKIKELATPNEDTLHVVLDPESVGLSKGFGAYMNSDDPVVPYIREQHEAGNPIDIGLEYVRRQKTKDSKTEISPVAPIHALRGAENADGTGNNAQMMGASGNHIRAIVGLINGRRTTVTESDPREWKMLTGNRKGDLPPEGWKALRDPEDWTKIGAITPKGGVTPTGTPSSAHQAQQDGTMQGVDMNVLAKIIGNEVRKGLKDYGEYLMRQEDATRGNPTSHAPNSAVEGKPWNLWVNKEQLNLGSYLVAGEGYALRWAFTYLGTLGDDVLTNDTELRWEAARELADATQKIADRVQATAYNGEVRADRSSASFKEAVMWVRFHIEHAYPFSAAEDFDYDAWFSNVGRTATASLKEAETSAHSFITERYPKAQQATQEEPSSQTPGNDRTPVVDAFLQMLTQQWTDRDGVFGLAREAKQKGLLEVTVWANPHDGKFSVEPFDGGREITIGHLTKNQYSLLSQVVDANTEEQPQEPTEAPTEAPAEPPHEDETPHQGPTSTPPQNTPAAEPPQRTAQHIAADLARATTEDQIAVSFGEARSLNVLTAEIAVQHGAGTFGLTPVRPNTEGAEVMTLGAVFDALRAAIDTDKQETTPQDTSSEAPSTSSVEDSAPGPQEPRETPAQDAPATGSSDNPAQDIAERAQAADSPEEINALITEAQEKGLSAEVISIRGGRGPLEKFLDSRLKRAGRVGR